MDISSDGVSGRTQEGQHHSLKHKGNETAWNFVNKPWDTNDAGDMIVSGRRNVGMHLAPIPA